MGKFEGRVTYLGRTESPQGMGGTFDTAYEAWEWLRDLHTQEEVALYGDEWSAEFGTPWDDMNELAQPESYNDENIFGVRAVRSFGGTHGTGSVWCRTPGQQKSKRDQGFLYSVYYSDVYDGL